MELKHGAVAGGHEEVCNAAMQVLRKGGNAVDATLAALFASCVVEPSLTSLGGSGYAVVKFGDDIISYDFFSTYPSKHVSSQNMEQVVVDFGGVKEPFLAGYNSIAMPGNMHGISKLHDDYGTLDMSDIISPAVHLAENGVVANTMQSSIMRMLSEIFTFSDDISRVYCIDGAIPREGDVLYNHRLAEFMKSFAENGLDVFKEEMHKFIHDNNVPLSKKDIDSYKVKTSDPICTEYYNNKVYTPMPTSAGGFLISLYLKLSDAFTFKAIRHGSAEYIQAIGNILRKGYEIHASNMIKSFYDGTWKDLLSDESLEVLRKDLLSSQYGGERLTGNTTHTSIMDKDGNAVSITTTNGEGSGIMLNNTGIHMNNMLGESIYYAQGRHKFSAGDRLISMMSPTIVLNSKNDIELVLGTGGIDRIPSMIFEVILNSIVYEMNPRLAVEQPRIHFSDGKLNIEPGFDKSELDKVKGFNCKVWESKGVYFGGINIVDGRGKGFGDFRRQGHFVCE